MNHDKILHHTKKQKQKTKKQKQKQNKKKKKKNHKKTDSLKDVESGVVSILSTLRFALRFAYQ